MPRTRTGRPAAERNLRKRLERTAAAIQRGDLVRDVYGKLWEYHSARLAPVAPVVIVKGWAHPRSAGRGSGGGLTYVLTPELVAYLDEHQREPGIHAMLGVSSFTIGRWRAALELSWGAARDAWWIAREDDLRSLAPDVFAKRHRQSYTATVAGIRLTASGVRHQRLARLGRRRREEAWYLAPDVRALIDSDTPLHLVAWALGIPAGYAKTLRARIRHGRY